jgi:hypothetical protein
VRAQFKAFALWLDLANFNFLISNVSSAECTSQVSGPDTATAAR